MWSTKGKCLRVLCLPQLWNWFCSCQSSNRFSFWRRFPVAWSLHQLEFEVLLHRGWVISRQQEVVIHNKCLYCLSESIACFGWMLMLASFRLTSICPLRDSIGRFQIFDFFERSRYSQWHLEQSFALCSGTWQLYPRWMVYFRSDDSGFLHR